MLQRIILTIILMFFSSVLSAQSWSVERVNAKVHASSDGVTWSQLKTGDTLGASTWIQTGPRGRLILERGSERIIFRPDTLASIAVSQPSGKAMRLTQRSGSVLLSIDPAMRRETEVETPHLAAVVLGTVFEVSVEAAGSSLRVDEGGVQVRRDQDRIVIEAGQQAAVFLGALNRVVVTPSTVSSLIQANGRVFVEPYGQLRRVEVRNGNNARGNNGSGNNGRGNNGRSNNGSGNNGRGNGN